MLNHKHQGFFKPGISLGFENITSLQGLNPAYPNEDDLASLSALSSSATISQHSVKESPAAVVRVVPRKLKYAEFHSNMNLFWATPRAPHTCTHIHERTHSQHAAVTYEMRQVMVAG